ncbi:ABC transporter ATP-binding protein [Brucepastera parasyntrophica]|uniref:ABC transporter ATP-binding protein n=1 Tax=Brucepastera parasyntrophica TaxID=2880008 RepID=UPI00210CFAF4|nr:ABC transporter ATP-binding protein [Brucepastera parasyntrophica]ULQ60014.1 ABC transporter ATP-binding protein [Brucepastera parasyntrophica]
MIQVKNISKSYGNIAACTDISFRLRQGTVTALLGPNGAGKSTILKIAAGVIFPDSGTVTVNGYDMFTDPIQARSEIGIVFENNPLYTDQTVQEYLLFIAKMYGLSHKDSIESVSACIKKYNLAEVLQRPIKELSHGFRQRTGLAAALVHNPSILILDEPTNGLDPLQIDEFRKIIREYASGKTVIISTHIMQEVELLCDSAIMINRGGVLMQGPFDEIYAKTGKKSIEDAFIHLVRKSNGAGQ